GDRPGPPARRGQGGGGRGRPRDPDGSGGGGFAAGLLARQLAAHPGEGRGRHRGVKGGRGSAYNAGNFEPPPRRPIMTEPIWNRFLPDRDRPVFAAAGYAAPAGFGHRPALLVIDVNYNFCGDRREPILKSIERWRNSCGEEAWDGVARIRELIDVAHAQGVPVIYTTAVRRADHS